MKPHLIKIENEPMFRAVERELEVRGIKWVHGKRGYYMPAFNCIHFDGESPLTADWTTLTRYYSGLPLFDAATQFGEWLAFLDEPEKPKLPFGGEISAGGGCRLTIAFNHFVSLSAEQIDTIHAASQAARTEGRK